MRRGGFFSAEQKGNPPWFQEIKKRFKTITDKVQGNSCLQNAIGANV